MSATLVSSPAVSSGLDSGMSGWLKRSSFYATVVACLIGCATLLGWIIGSETLTSILPGLSSMKVNTALCFILAGVGIMCVKEDDPNGGIPRLSGWLCGGLVILVATMTLIEYGWGVNLRIDELLIHDWLTDPAKGIPGRMGVNTAMTFFALGTAVVLLDAEWRGGFRPSQYLALGVGFSALMALMGYVYSVPSRGGIASYTQMAIHTGFNFALLSLGLLGARPERGIMRVMVSQSMGGFLGRRLILTGLLIPPSAGWLRFQGELAGWYGTEFGLAIFTALNMCTFAFLAWMTSLSLDRIDGRRMSAEADLRNLNAELEVRIVERTARLEEAMKELDTILEGAADGIVTIDESGNVLRFNGAAERLFGYLGEEVIRRDVTLLMPSPYREEHRRYVENYLRTGERKIIGKGREVLGRRKDGSTFPMELAVSETIFEDRRLFTGIIRDITERKHAEEEIRGLNHDLERRAQLLEAANQELEAFSYSVSHDLRAPLRHINGFIDLLKRSSASKMDSETKEYFEIISDSAGKMGVLIDDLLSFSRMGRTEMRRLPVDLGKILGEVLRNQAPDLAQRRIEWKIAELPNVVVDRAMLRLVFENLIANAVKFTAKVPAARIEVGCREGSASPGEVIIFVKDNGAGFDMRYAEKLFGVFQRLHRSDEFEGTGIGLANVRRIIHRHGGRTWAEGKVDEGATFYFSLPK